MGENELGALGTELPIEKVIDKYHNEEKIEV